MVPSSSLQSSKEDNTKAGKCEDQNEDEDADSSSLNQNKKYDLMIDVLKDTMHRAHFLMHSDFLMTKCPPQSPLGKMFQTCLNSCRVDTSTIPNAGNGLFATRDIPKHTIIAFYPIHAVGYKLDYSTISVQMVPVTKESDERIHHETSQYALNSLLGNLPLHYGSGKQYNVETEHPESKLIIDANPNWPIPNGWYGGYTNDGAIVSHIGDTDYYPTSRSRQNVEHVPFYPGPFQVSITTRDVKAGEEFFVSYGYNYWVNSLNLKEKDVDTPTSFTEEESKHLLKQQTEQVANDIRESVMAVQKKYKDAGYFLDSIMQSMGNTEAGINVLQDFLSSTCVDEETNDERNQNSANARWALVSRKP